jgi:hypothetical protein
LPRLKYDKSKPEEYQVALITSLGNLWVIDSIGHLGADGLTNLLQQCVSVATKCTFGNKPLRVNRIERHYHKPWFNVDYRTIKCELTLWGKANLDSHATKHQENQLKILLKRNFFFWKTTKT